jgi:hypothetical protein
VASRFLSIIAPEIAPELKRADSRSWVEQRAIEIDDPVKRLRYLRGAMKAPETRKRRRGSATLALLIVPMLVGLTPARIQSVESIPQVLHAEPPPPPVWDTEIASVWRVETTKSAEVYSNGLRIELAYATNNRPRSRFPIYPTEGDGPSQYGQAPVGIVYHTTESHLAPFEEEATRRLKQLGQYLLSALRQEHSYHYLVDRFGRVFRVVEESQAAYHAGFSVWADSAGVYLNLNDSFLGVAFEGQTGAIDEVTPAQIVSAKMLTDMLRSRYQIAAGNCVTHAQVSVNPEHMRIAAHTDWAGRFPFAELGLPNNYDVPVPSVYVFGFGYDAAFLKSAGMSWKGLELAEEQIRMNAGAAGARASTVRYRAALQRRYRAIAPKNNVGEIKKFSQGDSE